MIYVYNCERCNRSKEEVRKIEERNDPVYCIGCGREMVRVPCYHGGLKTEHPPWLDDHVRGAISDPAEMKITTRTEHDRICKEKGIAHL